MIYIVEDDDNIRDLEIYALNNSGFPAQGFISGEELAEACQKELPALILLDIMLPDEDGLQILQKLRCHENTAYIPVIMVTAKTGEIDKVKGLDLGADDYICKPFSVLELISRVKALLRRTDLHKSTIYQYDQLILDDEKHLVYYEEKLCQLTFKEYELLKYLLLNKAIVLSREKIMDKVWGFDYEGESRTVDMHIKTLRQKLGLGGKYIKTIRNVGYKIGE